MLKLYRDFVIISKQNMLAMNCDNNNNIIILFKETIHDPTQVELRPKLSAGEFSSTKHTRNHFEFLKITSFKFLLIFPNGTEYHQKGYLDLTNFDLLFSSEF